MTTVTTIRDIETGETGKAGSIRISNNDFVASVFRNLPDGASAAICSKSGDPVTGGWKANRAEDVVVSLSSDNNNYVACSSFFPGDDDSFNARKERFAACHFLMLDDIGTKIPHERLAEIELSWLIETSPGNHQGGIILAEPITDGDEAVRLLNGIIDAGLCDKGASGPLTRWARLPDAINGKPKNADETGAPFRCRLIEWRPEKLFTAKEIMSYLAISPASTGKLKKEAKPSISPPHSLELEDEVLTPKAAENPVITALKSKGLYKMPLGSGRHDVTCPWVHEHTDELDNGAAYLEPDDNYPSGGFCCKHSHGGKLHIKQLLEFLEVPSVEARHKPTIRVHDGDLHLVVDAAEKVLAKRGRHYQAGGLIVSVSTDLTTGDPSIAATSAQALTKELSITATFSKYDKRAKEFLRCDPPTRHVSVLYDSKDFKHLPPLAGLTRQPYFREKDGELVMEAGYDRESCLFGVFDSRQFPIPEPTVDAATEALKLLEELLTEFHFVDGTDKAAALAAIFTAVVRPTLAKAPGFHVRAPVYGSGKTYLCELIGAFAGPAGNAKVSYPTTSEEATKVILSLLLTNPAVVEFDDMDTDWIPHGSIKRMLTADRVTDRILGGSKTATVSTRSLFLGSGNNVGPIRDLLRRILTIHIDPRCSTPATLSYKGYPVDKVLKQRGIYVAAVLTIILAWRKAGSPRAKVENIATYGGEWSDYCRHPLIWLGHPDPATALLEQVKHDPDTDALAGLLIEWRNAFGSTPTTVRKAVDLAESRYPDLLDAIREFPVDEKGSINRAKLGWLLKKHADRIVKDLFLQEGEAGGRKAYRVVAVSPSLLPPLPASIIPISKTVTAASGRMAA